MCCRYGCESAASGASDYHARSPRSASPSTPVSASRAFGAFPSVDPAPDDWSTPPVGDGDAELEPDVAEVGLDDDPELLAFALREADEDPDADGEPDEVDAGGKERDTLELRLARLQNCWDTASAGPRSVEHCDPTHATNPEANAVALRVRKPSEGGTHERGKIPLLGTIAVYICVTGTIDLSDRQSQASID